MTINKTVSLIIGVFVWSVVFYFESTNRKRS